MGDKISYVECTVIDAKFQGYIEDFPREIPLSQQMYQFLISINVSVPGW